MIYSDNILLKKYLNYATYVVYIRTCIFYLMKSLFFFVIYTIIDSRMMMKIGSKLAGVVFGEEIERMDRLFMLLSKTPLIYRQQQQQQKREREMICSQQQLHSTFGEFGRASFSEDERVLRAACLIESSPACSSILPQPAHCIAAQGMEGSAFESTYIQATIFETKLLY